MQNLVHFPNNIVACICEGNAEREIISLLLENDCLIFNADDLIEGEPLGHQFRSAKKFESQYGGMRYEGKIEIIRVLDSKKELFKISEGYEEKVAYIANCYTTPEVEMLYIINQNEYEKFKNSEIKKPSDYCKQKLSMGNKIKARGFCQKYFEDINELLVCIKRYHSIRPNKDSLSIYNLLKDQYKKI